MHDLFILKIWRRDLRKGAAIGITNNEASDVAYSRAGTSKSGNSEEGRKFESFKIQAHLKDKPPIGPQDTACGALFGSLEFLKG